MRHYCRLLWLMALLASTVALAATPADGDYYNQGNAHARAGEWGIATLDYQRARLLKPNDPDLDANLRYVQAAAKLTDSPATLTARIARMTTPDIAAGIGLLGLIALGCALLWRPVALRMLGVLVGLPLVGFGVAHALALRPLVHGAVVIRGPAPAQVSPVPMAEALFSLPEAESVVINASRPDYLLITDRRGKVGWVSRSQIEPIVPAP